MTALEKFDALEHLLTQAIALEDPVKKNRYPIQEELERECQLQKKLYVYSMPVRHLFKASNGEMRGEIHHTVVNAKRTPPERVNLKESELHEARMGAKALPREVETFLLAL